MMRKWTITKCMIGKHKDGKCMIGKCMIVTKNKIASSQSMFDFGLDYTS